MPLSIEEYITRYCPSSDARHSLKRLSSNSYQCLCPIHNENTPSFHITPSRNLWYCHGTCQYGGTLPLLINILEFGGQSYTAAYKRLEELEGGSIMPRVKKNPKEKKERKRNPSITEDQMQVLQWYASWCHIKMWDEKSTQASDAREYLYDRGVNMYHDTLKQIQMGYAPGDPYGTLVEELNYYMIECLGQGWIDHALTTGIYVVDEDGSYKMRNQYRVMFFSTDHDGRYRYYQGRVVKKYEDRTTMKYLGPPLAKYPFTLSVTNPVLNGVVITESPFGPAVCHGHDIESYCTFGSGNGEEDLLLKFLTTRFSSSRYYASQDNDVGKEIKGKAGNVLRYEYPGENQAKKCIELLSSLGQDIVRLLPPRIIEKVGIDDWVCAKGPEPLLVMMRALGSEELITTY